MSFADEIFHALTGRRTESRNFEALVTDVAQFRAEVGLSRRGFARQYGIPESTLRRWERDGVGSKAQAARLPQLVSAYRQLISSPAAVARWRANGMSITVDGVPTRGGSGRTTSLSLDAGRLKLKAGTGDRVVEAYLRGDDAGAANAFVAGIGDAWYRNVLFRSWIGAHDDDLEYEGAHYDDGDDYFVTASAS